MATLHQNKLPRPDHLLGKLSNPSKLRAKGIVVDQGYWTIVRMNTRGLAWLLNFLSYTSAKGSMLRLATLNALASWDGHEDGDSRNVMLQMQWFPTHTPSGIRYSRVSIHLDASPPTYTYDTPITSISTIGREFRFGDTQPANNMNCLKLPQNFDIVLEFTDEEVQLLNSGGMLEVSINDH